MTDEQCAHDHHYLPRSYLAGFTDTGDKKTGKLYVLDKRFYKFIGQRSIKGIAWEPDWHAVSFPGASSDAFEKNVLGQFEQCVADTIKRVQRDLDLTADADHLNVLLNFIALTAVRVPYHRRGAIATLESETGKPFDEAVALSKSWQFIMRWLPSLNIGWDVKDCEAFLARDKSELAKAENYHWFSMLLSMNTILDMLGDRTWSLLVAEDDACDFICSDNPVGLHFLSPPTSEDSSPFFSDKDTIVTFPLTRKLALKGTYTEDNSCISIGRVPPQLVAATNSQTMERAMRYFYSPKNDFFCISRNGEVTSILEVLDRIRSSKL